MPIFFFAVLPNAVWPCSHDLSASVSHSAKRITTEGAQTQPLSVPLTLAFIQRALNGLPTWKWALCRLHLQHMYTQTNIVVAYTALHLCPPNGTSYLRWPSPFLDHISIFMSCTIATKSTTATTITTFPQCSLRQHFSCYLLAHLWRQIESISTFYRAPQLLMPSLSSSSSSPSFSSSFAVFLTEAPV